MRGILVLLTVLLILTIPVLADTNQKAKLNGDNVLEIKVKQTAWNFGDGNINQDISVRATGNYQMVSQDNLVLISDSDYTGNINNTMNGTNLIRLNLDQFAKNTGSGDTAQGIEVTVEGNVQFLDQDIIVAVAGE